MKILYLETSSKNCSVAVSDNEKLLCLCEEVSENYKQSESLHTYVEWALEGAGISLKDIEAVSLGKGPGSYTGWDRGCLCKRLLLWSESSVYRSQFS